MITAGPAEAFWAPAPGCPAHGQMIYRPAMSRWECRGFDGEGCDHVVTDEELAWTPLGRTEGTEWQPGGGGVC